MFVFGNRPGVVGTAIAGPALPFAVVVGGNLGVHKYPNAGLGKGVITGFKDAGESGLGVSHTLRDRIYFWVFGARAGKAEVSGFAFADVCGAGVATSWSGFDTISSYFDHTQVATLGIPVLLVFGPKTARYGFLERYRFSLDDPNSGLGSFSFEFTTIPNLAIQGTLPPPVWVNPDGF